MICLIKFLLLGVVEQGISQDALRTENKFCIKFLGSLVSHILIKKNFASPRSIPLQQLAKLNPRNDNHPKNAQFVFVIGFCIQEYKKCHESLLQTPMRH